ncbi:hypothetical protein Hanom_Chr12g01084621 [Helianthus anomalus]
MDLFFGVFKSDESESSSKSKSAVSGAFSCCQKMQFFMVLIIVKLSANLDHSSCQKR